MFNSNWKKKVERKIEQEEKQKKELEERARQELVVKEQKKRNEKLKWLQDNFSCQICGKQPTGPGDRLVRSNNWDNPDETSWEDDWSVPNNLSECSICHGWACMDHIHKGVCKKCGEKL